MNFILKTFRKTHFPTIIIDWVIAVLCCVSLLVSEHFRSNSAPYNSVKNIITSAGIAMIAVFYTFEFVIEPIIFKKKILNDSGEILNALNTETPSAIGGRFFYSNTAVFLANWKIYYFTYDNILAAELKRLSIELTMRDGKIIKMPFSRNENPALLCAVLRSKNESINFSVNGRHIDRTQNER